MVAIELFVSGSVPGFLQRRTKIRSVMNHSIYLPIGEFVRGVGGEVQDRDGTITIAYKGSIFEIDVNKFILNKLVWCLSPR